MLTDVKEPMDIDLNFTAKQRFRINGNNNQILELDISDLGIINRVNETLPKIKQIAEKANDLQADMIMAESDTDDNSVSDEAIIKLGNQIKDMDSQLREYMDYIFDTNVSEVCVPSGTMYDVIGGKFKYEHVLDALTKLYADNIQSEYEQVKRRVAMHTAKYTKKAKKH